MAEINSIVSFFKSGNVFSLFVGILLAIWLNEIVSPEFILVFGLPSNPYALNVILWFIVSIIIIIGLGLFFKRRFKKITATWFFVGAGFVSLVYAGKNLYEISWLYYINVGKFLPNLTIKNYSFPAIYLFKLFRSIFFISVFGSIGYWNDLRKKEKVPEVQNPSTSLTKPNETDESWISKKWYATIENINKEDFEESRRCLLNSYHSYVQTHAGYIIALTIGFFTVISSFDAFLKHGFWQIQTFSFIGLMIAILIAIAFMFLRIGYWTLWVNVAITITIIEALDYFNVTNKTYSSKASNIAILKTAIKEQIQANIDLKKLQWYEKLAVKTAGRSFC